MRDFKLDSETHDWVIENGDWVIVEDAEEVAQAIKIHLLTLSGEWVLDVGIGLRTIDKIFNKATSDDEKELLIRKEVLSVIGVVNITEFEFEADRTNLSLNINLGATTVYSDILIEVST